MTNISLIIHIILSFYMYALLFLCQSDSTKHSARLDAKLE